MADETLSRHRVAFDLAKEVQHDEKPRNTGRSVNPEEAREYWFKLYYQSLKIVNGESPVRVLPKPSEE